MNDHDLFMVVAVGICTWIFVLLLQGAIIAFDKVRGWLRKRRAIREMVEHGKVPVDYDIVASVQRQINDIDTGVGGVNDNPRGTAELKRAVSGVRIKVARIRDAGFMTGFDHHNSNVDFERGVRQNPLPPGSGEAKQWVRGYCIARNVIDPKPYMDQA